MTEVNVHQGLFIQKITKNIRSAADWVLNSAKHTWLILYLNTLIQIILHFGEHPKLSGDPYYYVKMAEVFLGRISLDDYKLYYEQTIGTDGDLMVMAFFKRPITPFLGSLFARIPGISVEAGIGIVNAIYSLVIIFFLYKFVQSLGWDKKVCFTTVILFINAFPVLVLIASNMTDMGGYLFAVILLYLFFKNKPQFEQYNWKWYLIMGLVNGIGMLARETTLFTLVFIVGIFLLEPLMNYKKEPKWFSIFIKRGVYWAVAVIISAIMVMGWIYFGMNMNPLDLHIGEIDFGVFLDQDMIEKILFIFIIAFHLCYVFFIVGFLHENDRQRIFYLALYIICMVVPMFMQFFAVPFSHIPQYRLVFMVFPFVLPVAALGLQELAKNLAKKEWLSYISAEIWYVLLLGATILVSLGLSIPYMTEQILAYFNLSGTSFM